jgi:enamine deaminase RidA (YjgF/YER057c/UK114 family)
MASLSYTNEAGAGQKHSDECHYSQAVVIGDIVKCSGQGGWDNTGFCNANDIELQVKNAFENVDRVLQAVGLQGWEDVYSIRSLHVDIAESFPIMVKRLQERLPGHRPIWTSLGVPALAFPPMKIEIEVEAYKGSK